MSEGENVAGAEAAEGADAAMQQYRGEVAMGISIEINIEVAGNVSAYIS